MKAGIKQVCYMWSRRYYRSLHGSGFGGLATKKASSIPKHDNKTQ